MTLSLSLAVFGCGKCIDDISLGSSLFFSIKDYNIFGKYSAIFAD